MKLTIVINSKYIKLKSLITLFLVLTSTFCYCQDTIRTVSNEKIIAIVTEVNKEDIKYKKFNNPEGPTYSMSKDELISISYIIGEKEFFKLNKEIDGANELSDDELFDLLTIKNNVVFIYSENTNAIIHATNTISNWGYWAISKNKEDADFILKFNIRFGALGDAYGNALFIYPSDNRIIKSTKEVNTKMSLVFNTKRGVINKIIKKEIQPMF
jgi:hypothetical protein